MAKNTSNIPIMSADEERFLAFSGLIQWAQCVVAQAKRVAQATEQLRLRNLYISYELHPDPVLVLNCEHHYFVIAAYKLIEHRQWIKKFGLFNNVDFSEIDSFPAKDIKDLRNMREHVVEYFQGDGRDKTRWIVETPEYRADASSCVGTMIGGRLDFVEFTKATERLLIELLKERIPFPPLKFLTNVFISRQCVLQNKNRPTKRAPDVWESARFTGIFLASSFFYISSIVHAHPHAGNANRWALN